MPFGRYGEGQISDGRPGRGHVLDQICTPGGLRAATAGESKSIIFLGPRGPAITRDVLTSSRGGTAWRRESGRRGPQGRGISGIRNQHVVGFRPRRAGPRAIWNPDADKAPGFGRFSDSPQGTVWARPGITEKTDLFSSDKVRGKPGPGLTTRVFP